MEFNLVSWLLDIEGTPFSMCHPNNCLWRRVENLIGQPRYAAKLSVWMSGPYLYQFTQPAGYVSAVPHTPGAAWLSVLLHLLVTVTVFTAGTMRSMCILSSTLVKGGS